MKNTARMSVCMSLVMLMSPFLSLDFPRGADELDEDAEEPVPMSIVYEGAPRARSVHGLVRVTGGDPCGLESNR